MIIAGSNPFKYFPDRGLFGSAASHRST